MAGRVACRRSNPTPLAQRLSISKSSLPPVAPLAEPLVEPLAEPPLVGGAAGARLPAAAGAWGVAFPEPSKESQRASEVEETPCTRSAKSSGLVV